MTQLYTFAGVPLRGLRGWTSNV